MKEYTMETLAVGIAEEFQVKITKEMQDDFTRITGDVNPMHVNAGYEGIKRMGGKSVLVYGMLTASFYSTLVGVYLPGKRCLFHECNVAFAKPVYIGDTLTVFGEVVQMDETFQRITIKAYIKNQEGIKVSRAKLIVGVMGGKP